MQCRRREESHGRLRPPCRSVAVAVSNSLGNFLDVVGRSSSSHEANGRGQLRKEDRRQIGFDVG